MSKWGSRAVLVVLAVIVLMTLPYHALSVLARSFIVGRTLRIEFARFVADLREVVGFLRTAWREESEDGVDSGV